MKKETGRKIALKLLKAFRGQLEEAYYLLDPEGQEVVAHLLSEIDTAIERISRVLESVEESRDGEFIFTYRYLRDD